MKKARLPVTKARKARQAMHWRTVQVEVDGVRTNMFTIGALARALGKGVSTLRVWEAKGLLPETPYRSPSGVRLYTVEMMKQMRATLEQAGKLVVYDAAGVGNRSYVIRVLQFGNNPPFPVKFYRSGLLAAAIGRSPVTLSKLIERSAIPDTPFILGKLGLRLYTVEMIEAVQKAFAIRLGQIRGPLEWQCVYNEILRDWKKLGIFSAKIIENSDLSKGPIAL